MKKHFSSLFARFALLLVALTAFGTAVQAQCSASIPSGNQTICSGAPVSIPVTLSGTAPFTYTYQINGAPQTPVTTSASVDNLTLSGFFQSGVVVLTSMTDGTGCQGTVSGAVTIGVSPPIILFDTQTPVTCSMGNDGSIQIQVNGGVAPYAFAWSTGATGVSTLEGLDEGFYSVTVTDANGCTAVRTSTLALNYPNFTFDVTPATCNAADGAIDVDLTSPTAFNVWANGAGSTEDLVNIPAGTYILIVTESINGCTETAEITVPQVSSISLTPAITPASCFGSNDGGASVLATGGVAPYTYLWSNGSTSTLTGASAGVYTITVTDATSCTQTSSITITQLPQINIVPVVQSPTCGNADGAIDISITGGAGPYQTLWSTGSTLEDLSNIGAGVYTVTVTDANGCTRTLVNGIGSFELTIAVSTAECLGNLDLSVAGGTAPYTYLWSNNATTEDVAGLSGGTYSVTVTDAAGCSSVKSAFVPTLPSFTATIGINNSPCSGGLTAQLTGWPVSSATFVWSTGATTQSISNIAAGTYSVTVTSSIGCTATATITTTESLSNAQLVLSTTATPVSCFGAVTGAVNLTVSGAAPPFSFLWSNGAVTEDLVNLAAGSYFITVTDANGCTKTTFQNVIQFSPITATWTVTNPACNGTGQGSINLNVSGGALPYAYAWRNQLNDLVSTAQDPNGIPTGIYRVTITDANGCTFTSPDILVQSPFFSVEAQVLSAQCSNATLTVDVSGGAAPFVYVWSGPASFMSQTTNVNITVPLSGTYVVTVTDINGCTAQSVAEVTLIGGGICGYISGRVVRDEVDNCLVDAGEPGLGDWLVRAESPSDTFYGVTDAQGNYWVNVPPGTYTMAALPPNALWGVCPSGASVTVGMQDDTVSGGDFPAKVLFQCPSLSVFIGTNALRRCFSDNFYYVNYCNQGTTPATGAYVVVTLDPFITPIASSIPFQNLGGGILRFDVGDLELGECGAFQIRVQVSCNAAFGQTHCTEAHIFPDGTCLPNDLNWSGASLRVTSQCSQDSVRFTIQNIGSGDMQGTSDYIVVEDAVMLMEAPFQLASGASSVVSVPANGSTWRIEVEQVPFHPGLSAPALSVEGCTSAPAFSTGFVTQFPNNEADPWIDIDCTQNIGSYDPNDKQGFPVGYGTERYIRPGTELEYMIRFQNTGTDTAFTVRIVDTLSAWLDPATIRPGVSSHPYQFNFTGHGIAEFLFENILLPDSNVNQAGSNGFVKFSIYPRADAPLETLIENDAAIYFDFNEPVITNTTYHRLGENFMLVDAWQPQRPEYRVSVSPNPFSETARLEVKGLTSSQPLHLQVFDLQGVVVHEETVSGPVFHLRKGSLPTGLYLFKLDQKGGMIGNGKLMVRD